MKKTLLALASLVAATALPQVVRAEEPAAADPLSFNIGLTSDYRYRGISQTRLKPAVQAGVDYALPGGFYIGAWASTIKWIKDAGGEANVEIDLYGGYKGEIAKDLTYDVGVLTYVYPRNGLSTNANTTEIYGALTFGPATLKYSHSVTNLFGFADSKNSGYLDLSATFDVYEGLQLIPHVGYQRVAKNGDFSYTDYSLTVGKDFYGFFVSAAVVGTSAKKIDGVPAYYYGPDDKDLGKTGVVVAVKKTF
jgi:uncharacterized protein (TIGR02001 family)